MTTTDPLASYLRPGAEPEPVDEPARLNGNGNGHHPGAGGAAAAARQPATAATRPAPPGQDDDLGLDDIGNGARWVAQHGDRFRFVPAWGRWLVRDTQRWRDDDQLLHLRAARDTARAIIAEALEQPNEKHRDELLKHARRSASEGRLRAMAAIAAAHERIVVTPRELDADPFAVNAKNGVADLHPGGGLRPHRETDLFTKVAGGAYRPDATCPVFEAHLKLALVSRDLIDYLQKLVGVALIGKVLEHHLVILWGSGANGKSTLINALRHALGDYASVAPAEILMATRRSGGQASPDLANLRAARFVSVSETAEDGKLHSERVKAITGGDPITARFLYGQPFEFEPSHTFFVSTNHRPRIDDDGAAIWRRIVLIPFTQTIPEQQRDPHIGAKLAAEADAILTWAIQGARRYLTEGLTPPGEILAATSAYRAAEDIFGAFLTETTISEPDASVAGGELNELYAAWANRNSAPHLSGNAIADKLERRGYERRRTKGRTRYHGLRIAHHGTLDA